MTHIYSGIQVKLHFVGLAEEIPLNYNISIKGHIKSYVQTDRVRLAPSAKLEGVL